MPGNDAPLPGHQKKSCIPNPLVGLYMLFFPDTIIIALIHGVYYTTCSCIQASLSPLFIRIFGLTELQVGLAFPQFGLGVGVGIWIAGGVMDRDYRIVAAVHGIAVDKVRGGE